MHVQQQTLNICNTAIIGNHYDTSNKIKIYKDQIYRSRVNFKVLKIKLFPIDKISMLISFWTISFRFFRNFIAPQIYLAWRPATVSTWIWGLHYKTFHGEILQYCNVRKDFLSTINQIYYWRLICTTHKQNNFKFN
jgi:hypothetical protein